MISVSKNVVVYFRYSMENKDGSIIDNKMEGAPTFYLHGKPGIAPFLQSQFEGLHEGDMKTIHLNEDDDSICFKIIIDYLRPASDEEITLGYPVENKELCGPECNCKTDS